jgi:hypothetical protein
MIVTTNARIIRSALKDAGVTLYLGEDGGLRARGGDFRPELKAEAKRHKAELEYLLLTEHAMRESELADAKASWLSYTTPERGFFIGVLRNAVTEELRSKLAQVEEDFLNGLVDLKAVHEAFSDYAKASRRRYMNRQLTGDVYLPSLGGRRKSQAEIHAAFKEMGNGTEDIKPVFRTSVTPQIEPQPDQLERMRVYFGIDRTEYIASRLDR